MKMRTFQGALLMALLGASGCGDEGSGGGSGGAGQCSATGDCVCGDGVVSPGETCDDGAAQDGNACSATCQEQRALHATTGAQHSCAVLSGGLVKCWGRNVWNDDLAPGILGLGDKEDRGGKPGEMGSALPPVDLGAGVKAVAVESGWWHTCALLEGGGVKCWGYNKAGQLGVGDYEDRGDEPGEMGDALPLVDLGQGAKATAIAAGYLHACAILEGGSVKCWGFNDYGQLGTSDTLPHGGLPGTMGDALPPIDLGAGAKAVSITAGDLHTCAALEDGRVKCWGDNRSGQLGLGDIEDRGDGPGEMGDNLPVVDLGAGKKAVAVASSPALEGTASLSTCALLSDGSVKCWGSNLFGQLGLGESGGSRGKTPGEMGDNLPAVDLGAGKIATAIVGGGMKNCALLEGGGVKCWGVNGGYSVLGTGDEETRGDEPGEMGDALPMIELGAGKRALGIDGSSWHSCAWIDDGSLKCWGFNSAGQLGLGDAPEAHGDEPGEMGDALPPVKLFSDAW